jgi:CBS domain containing-hemolysin-like protein
MGAIFYLTICAVCLAAEIFFSGSEIALLAASPKKIKKSSGSQPGRTGLTRKLLQNRERMLATTLFGTNLSVVTNATLLTSFFLTLFPDQGELYAVIVLSPILLIFGEIIPKILFQQYANTIAPVVSYPIWLASCLFYPLVFLVTRISNFVIYITGARKSPHIPFVTREELRLIVKMSKGGSDLTAEEVTMIERLFDFSRTVVKEAMIPLIDIATIEDTASVGEAIAFLEAKGYSRIPVYHDRTDNLIGIINSFDLLESLPLDGSIRPLIRRAPYVPETKPLDGLLIEMQKKRNHLSIVVDEYGGTVGIITIEDILEEIVGEIQDEYDTEQQPFRKIGRNKYIIRSRMEKGRLEELLSITLPEGDFETLGGFLLDRLGHIPQPGEVLKYGTLTFTILSSDERSIGEVGITIDRQKSPSEGGEPRGPGAQTREE